MAAESIFDVPFCITKRTTCQFGFYRHGGGPQGYLPMVALIPFRTSGLLTNNWEAANELYEPALKIRVVSLAALLTASSIFWYGEAGEPLPEPLAPTKRTISFGAMRVT